MYTQSRRAFARIPSLANRAVGIIGVAAVVLTCSVALGAAAAGPDKPAEWKVGIATVVITPDQPMWMAGYAARSKPSEGKVHDLHAKALALEDVRGTRLVIVTADLIGFPREFRDRMEKEAADRYKLGRESLLLSVSHTHSGPELRAWRSTQAWDLAPEQIELSKQYAEVLHGKIVELVGRALADLAPAQLSYLHARAGFGMNRRLQTDRGYTIGPNADGPVDHDVPVLRVDKPDGTLRALLFEYACHNTTLDFYQFCGDYAGFAQEYVEQTHPGAVALFMIGCGADQNPVPRRTLDWAKQHGQALANAVEAALLTRPRPVHGPLHVALDEATLELEKPASIEQLKQRAASTYIYEKRYAEQLIADLQKTGGVITTYPYLVQVAQFGNDLTMVGLAGEVVVDYSLRLKAELAGAPVWVAGYCNDVFGYVPSKRVLTEGGYEARDAILYYGTIRTPFTASVEERIIGKVHELVDKVRTAKSE